MEPDEIEALSRRLENKLKTGWRAMIRAVQDDTTLSVLEHRIATNDIAELLQGLDGAVTQFTSDISSGYVHSAQKAARSIDAAVNRAFRFNLADSEAVQWMNETAEGLASSMIEEQQQVAQRVVQQGRARGLAPRAIAEEVRASVGLNAHQVDQVARYRTLLETGDYRRALSYELADGRYDATLRRAAQGGDYLGGDRIDAMVARYRDNWVRSRGATVALTEAQNATHAGVFEAFDQAMEQGFLDEIPHVVWHTRGDHKVRQSHRYMSGQPRPFGVPFTSGDGNRLRYPGDSNAPAEDRVHCRCYLEVKMPATFRKVATSYA